MNATTLADEFEGLCLVDLYNPNLHVYPDRPEVIKSSKNVNAVLYQGFYYNHFRTNKNPVQYKCREKIYGKECNGSFTLNNCGNSFTLKSHKHSPMFPIKCEIKKVRLEIDKLILENPSCSISKIWDKKLIELTLKYS